MPGFLSYWISLFKFNIMLTFSGTAVEVVDATLLVVQEELHTAQCTLMLVVEAKQNCTARSGDYNLLVYVMAQCAANTPPHYETVQ